MTFFNSHEQQQTHISYPLPTSCGCGGGGGGVMATLTSAPTDHHHHGSIPSAAAHAGARVLDEHYRTVYIASARALASSLNNMGALHHEAGHPTAALECYQQAVRVRMDALRGSDAAASTATSSPGKQVSSVGPAIVRADMAADMVRRSEDAAAQEAQMKAELALQFGPACDGHPPLSGLDLFDLMDGQDGQDGSSDGGNDQSMEDSDGGVPVPEVVFSTPLHISPAVANPASSSPGTPASPNVADDHRGSAVTLLNMGLVHATNGSLDKAAQLFAMAKSVVKPSADPALAACILNNVACVKYQSHQATEAIQVLTKALRLEQTAFAEIESKQKAAQRDSARTPPPSREQVVGIEETIIATLSLMSRLHFAHGDSSKSVELGRETLRIRRSLLGEDHLDVACSLYNIGLALQRLGDVEESIRHCSHFATRFVNASSSSSNMSHLIKATSGLSDNAKAQVGTALHNLGVLQLQNDSVTESVRTLEAALSLRRMALHADASTATIDQGLSQSHVCADPHPDVADSLYQLGQIFQNTGRDREAMECYREAVHIFRTTIGPDHEDVAVVCCAMGQLHQGRGETDEALALYNDVLRIARMTFGPSDAFVGEVLGIIGNVHLERGDTNAAMSCFSESTRIINDGSMDAQDQQPQQTVVVPSLAGFHLHPHAAAA